MKQTMCTAAGLVGGALSAAFGGWTGLLSALLILMAADYVTGLAVAGLFHKSRKSEGGALESKAGWKGLCRKCMTLLLVLAAHQADLVLGTACLRDGVIVGFCANELLSLTENAGLMGLPMPKVLRRAVDALAEKEDESDDEDQ